MIGGGLSRTVSLIEVGLPSTGNLPDLAMELGVVPLLLLWQAGGVRHRRASGDE